MSEKSPVILVDASSYLFRAYHAMPALNNSRGEPTGAVYGVVAMTRRLIQDYQPTFFAMVFDAKGRTFRNDLYPDYKANRPPMPDELRCQIEPLHQLIRQLGIPLVMESGVEADDVIGTLARRFADAGQRVLISTGDKDLAQLVDEKISLVNTMNQHRMTPVTVVEKFGVRAEQIIDYLALMGDVADNVPGVPKVGPKTAAKWLGKYGDIDTLVAHADQIGGKVGENLRGHLAQLSLAKDLVTIQQRLPLSETLEDLRLGTPEVEAVAKSYRQLEFKHWLAELYREAGVNAGIDASADTGAGQPSDTPSGIDTTHYECVLEPAQLERWIKKITRAEQVAFDTETTSLDAMQARLVGLSLAVADGDACYIPLLHRYLDAPKQLDKQQTLAALKPWLEDPQAKKVGQNLKYDSKILANEDIQLAGIEDDTMLASYMVDSVGSRHDMNTLALKYLGHHCIHFEDIAGKGKKQLTFDQIALDQAAPYAAEDADVTWRLHHVLQAKLAQAPRALALYREVEVPLLSTLAKMERNGVLVNADALAHQSLEISTKLLQLERQAFAEAGHEFNLNSPKQLQAILFDELALPVRKKTPKGQPSTAEEVLQELAQDFPLPKIILQHRSLSKLKSTYTDKLPRQINPRTGRIHTSYHQAVTATGRLSSSDPNLQNIPIRSSEGRRIRQAFIAPPGCRLIAADYSQIELRIMAHLSQDKGLLCAFAQGKDVHRATAAEIFAIAPAAVSVDQRRSAKAINFGLIYGMSAFGLARQLGVRREEAQQYMHTYFTRYPGVQQYMETSREEARTHGFVETILGRRLYLPEINARNGLRRQAAERAAINAPMQGTAADIIKRAMLDIDRWITAENLPLKMIMQVHDELIFEAPADAADTFAAVICAKMEHSIELSVPLTVAAGIGLNWDEAH